MVLNKKEKIVMKIIYERARGKNGQVILAPLDILQEIPYKMDFKEDELPAVLYDLSLEGYFSYTEAKKKSDDVYVITLTDKGLAYERDRKAERKKLIRRFIIAAIIAGFGFLIKQILNIILN